jgi:hypothetical protein
MFQPLTWTLIAWGCVTAALVVILIYRSLISMKEDDQLFLDPAQVNLQRDQQIILRRP